MPVCQDMQALLETAKQDQERREAINRQRGMRDGFTRVQVPRPIQGLSAEPPSPRQEQSNTKERIQQAEIFMAQQGYQNREYQRYRPPRPQRISRLESTERALTEAESDRAAEWFCRICRLYEKHSQVSCPNRDYCSICQGEGHSDRYHAHELGRAEEQE